VNVDCRLVPFSGVVFPFGDNTCTWFGSGIPFTGAESGIVPDGPGVITRIRVKGGASGGPMQVTILRSIRSRQVVGTTPGGAGVNVACCIWQGESQVFAAPPPGQIGPSVGVRLPVVSEYIAQNDAYNFDSIALSILAPGVGVPLHDSGDYNGGPATGTYYPHLSRGQQRVDSRGSVGYQILLQADWEPDADRDGFGDESRDSCPGNAAVQFRSRREKAHAAACPRRRAAAGTGCAEADVEAVPDQCQEGAGRPRLQWGEPRGRQASTRSVRGGGCEPRSR